jgi:hypothetical protein
MGKHKKLIIGIVVGYGLALFLPPAKLTGLGKSAKAAA